MEQVTDGSQVHRLMSQYLNAHVRQDLFSWLLPLCYRNSPTQAHPARYRLLRFLVFLFRYMLLGLLSLVNRASLNQRAVGSTPTPPTKNQLNSEALAGKLLVRIQPLCCLAKISLGNRNILKVSTAARDHAWRQVEWYPEHSSALNRFE